MPFEADRKFASFEECAEFLRDDAVRNPLIETCSGARPRYIYRGEAGRYETTPCSEDRPDTYLLSDGRWLAPDDRCRLGHLKDFLLWRLKEDDYALNTEEALGFLQHYGVPTRVFDFTADLRCALAFAASKSADLGRIAVMQWPQSSPYVSINPFWLHPWANRARRQNAVGISIIEALYDLKSDASRSQLGLQWYEFPIAGEERRYFLSKQAKLLSYGDDEAAGFLRFMITEYVEAHGKLSPTLTDWLLSKIPIAALAFTVKGFGFSDATINFRTTNRLSNFRLEDERLWTSRYWSSDHPDCCSFDRTKTWELPDVGTITADPRTHHPDLKLASASLKWAGGN